ncbi:MAG TPA: CNNM domain-containing protein [Chthoniobacterales bacterium]
MTWAIVLLCLSVSFVFSGAEAGLLSLNRVRLRHLARRGDAAALHLQRLVQHPTRLFVTVLVVTNLMNIAAIVIVANHLVGQWGGRGYFLALALALPVFLVVIEFCSKAIFRRLGYRALARLAVFLEVALFMMSPFVLLARPFARQILRRPARGMFLARADLKYVIAQNERLGMLSSFERQMIHNVVDFRTVRVKDVMVPLEQTRCVQADASVEEVIKLSRLTRAERFPVLDAQGRVIGLVNVIDLVVDRTPHQPVSSFLRRIVEVRPDDLASRVMRRLRAAPQHFALVVDGANRPVGVVGLTNLLYPLVRPGAGDPPSGTDWTMKV